MANSDKWKNGAIFGALFGVLALYAANLPSSFLSFISPIIHSISSALMGLSFMSWASGMGNFLDYTIAAIIGAVIGAVIDAR